MKLLACDMLNFGDVQIRRPTHFSRIRAIGCEQSARPSSLFTIFHDADVVMLSCLRHIYSLIGSIEKSVIQYCAHRGQRVANTDLLALFVRSFRV